MADLAAATRHLQTHGELFLFPLELGYDSVCPIHVVRRRLLLLLILSFVVLFLFFFVGGFIVWVFFKLKCVVNKLTFGFFVLTHVEWKVLHFVEQLILILTQAEKKVVNPFL